MQRPTTKTVLDREFLQIRSSLLDLAAALDRLDRDPQGTPSDDRRSLIQAAIEQLLVENSDRAEAVQRIFSLPYQDQWRTIMEL